MNGLQAVTICGALVFGLSLALLARLELHLTKRLDLSDRQTAGLLAALNLTLIPVMVLSGVLLDRWGARAVVVVGSIVLSLAVLSLSAAPSYARACAAVLAAGFGAALLNTASVVLMPHAFFPSEPAASLNLGLAFVALGALVCWALADVLLMAWGLRRTVALFAFLCLLPAFAAALPGADSLPTPPAAPLGEGPVSHAYLWLAGLVFLFYAPLEAGISQWTVSHLGDPDRSERGPFRLLAGFWIMLLAGRLLVALLQHVGVLPPESDGPMLIVLALLAAVVLGNMAGTARRGAYGLSLMVLGLLLGPLFPTLVGMVFRHFARQQGTAYGLLFAFGSVGSLVLAPVLSTGTGPGAPQAGLRVPILLALALAAAGLVFGLLAPS